MAASTRGVPEPRAPRPLQARQPAAKASKGARLEARPYLSAAERRLVAQGTRRRFGRPPGVLEWPVVYHVDFSADEVGRVFARLADHSLADGPRSVDHLAALCRQHDVASLVGDAIRGRSAEHVRNFCSDLVAGRAAAPDRGRVLSLDHDADGRHGEHVGESRISSLLLARETEGNGHLAQDVHNEFRKAREDSLAVTAEFTNCAGDLSALAWVPDGNVLCGTTAHSDAHNQQYNKLGNLLLCSTARGTLRAFADHRVPRPRVDRSDNASEAMRRSQDPWLYASVVSADYDAEHGRAYTSSFDGTVKVWAVARDGSAMEAVATWQHGGNVNFVAAARDGSGRVASAADVPCDAVRVYTVRPDDVGRSPYVALSCSRAAAGGGSGSGPGSGSPGWAYFPAALQWGRAPAAAHLLLVGYSPRSLANDDGDIPDDKRDTGEIVLWDAARGRRIPVLTATTANVFEVAWHPSLPRFAVATSPCGLTTEHGVRTQVHLFEPDSHDGAYREHQKLDCRAADINELAMQPNSLRHAYVAAGCTDGNVYVWDTAQGDAPVHVLRHGASVDDCCQREDTGVKFAAWGTSPDRLYTGSSDGVVKVWNVRRRRRPFVRDLLEAPGPISIGAFAPDRARLAVGDATGRLFLLSLDRRDEHPAHLATLPGPDGGRRVRRPTPFIPHPEPPPPPPAATGGRGDDDDDADEPPSAAAHARAAYLASGQLVLHPSPVVGAVQGPAYARSGLFRRDAHVDEDPARPLLPDFERVQRRSLHASHGRRPRSQRCLVPVPPTEAAAAAAASPARDERHRANRRRDLDALPWEHPALWDSLRSEGAVLSDDGREDWGFSYVDDAHVDDEEPSGS